MFLRQRGQGAAQADFMLFLFHLRAGRGGAMVGHGVEDDGIGLGPVAAQAVAGAVAGDGQQPRGKFLRLAQFTPLMVRLEKGVLHDVLGLRDVLQDGVGDDIDFAAIGSDDGLKGLVIPGQGGHDHDPLGGIHRGGTFSGRRRRGEHGGCHRWQSQGGADADGIVITSLDAASLKTARNIF